MPGPDLAGAPPTSPASQGDLNALGLFPRISVRDAKTQVQRGDEYEATYSRKVGSRTYSATRLSRSGQQRSAEPGGASGGISGVDILPDVFSNASIFDAGNFQSWGYTGAVTQDVGEHVSVTVMYGGEGALTRGQSPPGHRQPGGVARVAARSAAAGCHVARGGHRTVDRNARGGQLPVGRRRALGHAGKRL